MSSIQLYNDFNVFVYYFCHLCPVGSMSPLCITDSNHLYLLKPPTQAPQQGEIVMLLLGPRPCAVSWKFS